jgi:hypothetical protein
MPASPGTLRTLILPFAALTAAVTVSLFTCASGGHCRVSKGNWENFSKVPLAVREDGGGRTLNVSSAPRTKSSSRQSCSGGSSLHHLAPGPAHRGAPGARVRGQRGQHPRREVARKAGDIGRNPGGARAGLASLLLGAMTRALEGFRGDTLLGGHPSRVLALRQSSTRAAAEWWEQRPK